MTDEQQTLSDWLAAQAWLVHSEPEIPAPVLAALRQVLTLDHPDSEALARYGAALSALCRFYRVAAYAHRQMLSEVLIKLGTCSQKLFWDSVGNFISMAPDFARLAIPAWAGALDLTADQQQQLRTEAFHALR